MLINMGLMRGNGLEGLSICCAEPGRWMQQSAPARSVLPRRCMQKCRSWGVHLTSNSWGGGGSDTVLAGEIEVGVPTVQGELSLSLPRGQGVHSWASHRVGQA